MPGESKPPAAQKLTPDETVEKEKQVYDLAIERLNSFCGGKAMTVTVSEASVSLARERN